MDVRVQDKNISPGGGNHVGGHGDSNNGASANNVFSGSNSTNKTLAAHHHHGAVIPADPARVGSISFRSKSSSSIRYRECLKNHGASMGTNVLDGCGEFMPSGQEGTLEALNCAACKCHRNFHRKEVSGEENSNNFPIINMIHPIHNFSITHHQMVQPVNAVAGYGGGATESSSEDLNNVFGKMTPKEELGEPSFMKKRFRTKFTPEQKERMMEFAEKLGWRLQKQDDEQVERFCDGLGIRRQVFKVWMHNNKSGSASKRTIQQLSLDQDLQEQQQQHGHEHQNQKQHQQPL